MRGGDVERLQGYLTEAGHRTGRDGAFGPRTRRALRATERELELHVDGVATPREQRAIRRAVAEPATGGGAVFVTPPPVTKVKPGAIGQVTSEGFAVPPASAPRSVKKVIAAGNEIALAPYKWGGGHRAWRDEGYDCSGSVSYALHGAGLLDAPLVSGAFGALGVRGARSLDHALLDRRPRVHGRGRAALRHQRPVPHRLALDRRGARVARLHRDSPRRPVTRHRVRAQAARQSASSPTGSRRARPSAVSSRSRLSAAGRCGSVSGGAITAATS